MKKPNHYLMCLLMIGGLTLLLVSSAWAKKVAVVLSRTAVPYNMALLGFEETIGWEVQTWNMEGNKEIGQAIMKKLTAGDVNVVVAIGGEASMAASYLKADIPLIYTMILNPIENKGRKIPSVILKINVEEQLGRMKKMFPTRKRIGVVYNPLYSRQEIDRARKFVTKNDMTLLSIAIDKESEVKNALLKMTNNTVDILWMVVDKTMAQPQAIKQIIIHSHQESIPFIGISMYHVKAGALAAFSVDFKDIGAQTAVLAKKSIKQGYETPRKITVYVNPKIQKKMGINDLSVFSEVKFIQ